MVIRILLFYVASFLCPVLAFAQENETPKDPVSNPAQKKLQQWQQANALETDDSAPYYLRLNLEIFDLEGKSLEKGTLERWAAPSCDDSHFQSEYSTVAYRSLSADHQKLLSRRLLARKNPKAGSDH